MEFLIKTISLKWQIYKIYIFIDIITNIQILEIMKFKHK